jgi:hypothetical protein
MRTRPAAVVTLRPPGRWPRRRNPRDEPQRVHDHGASGCSSSARGNRNGPITASNSSTASVLTATATRSPRTRQAKSNAAASNSARSTIPSNSTSTQALRYVAGMRAPPACLGRLEPRAYHDRTTTVCQYFASLPLVEPPKQYK